MQNDFNINDPAFQDISPEASDVLFEIEDTWMATNFKDALLELERSPDSDRISYYIRDALMGELKRLGFEECYKKYVIHEDEDPLD